MTRVLSGVPLTPGRERRGGEWGVLALRGLLGHALGGQLGRAGAICAGTRF